MAEAPTDYFFTAAAFVAGQLTSGRILSFIFLPLPTRQLFLPRCPELASKSWRHNGGRATSLFFYSFQRASLLLPSFFHCRESCWLPGSARPHHPATFCLPIWGDGCAARVFMADAAFAHTLSRRLSPPQVRWDDWAAAVHLNVGTIHPCV